jgi:hypothetical protein
MSDQEINNDIIIFCPHCNEPILIEKLNCRIFRHGIFKENGLQIPPHSSKEDCDNLIENNKIFGCGKPFEIIVKIKENSNEFEYIPEICDYK